MPNKKFGFYITRWTDRPLHKHMLFNINNAKEWETSQADLYIAYHGSLPFSDPVRNDSGIGLLDTNVPGYSNYGRTMRASLLDGLAKGYDYIAFLDDDSKVGDVKLMLDRAEECFTKDPLLGQTGPHDSYVAFIHYNNETDPYIHERKGPPWSTAGCQIYSRSGVEDTRHLWDPYFTGAQQSMDNAFHMALVHAGYTMSEYFCPGFAHQRSHAIARDYTLASVTRTLKGFHEDAALHVALRRDNKEYMARFFPEIKRLYFADWRSHLNFFQKRWPDYHRNGFPVGKSKSELLDFCHNYMDFEPIPEMAV